MTGTIRNLLALAVFAGTSFGATIQGSIFFAANGEISYSGGLTLATATNIDLSLGDIIAVTTSDDFDCDSGDPGDCVPELTSSVVTLPTFFNPQAFAPFSMFFDSFNFLPNPPDRYRFDASSQVLDIASDDALTITMQGTFTDLAGEYDSASAEIILQVSQAGGGPCCENAVSFSGTFNTPSTTTVVPEPATFALIGGALLAAGILRRRQKIAQQ